MRGKRILVALCLVALVAPSTIGPAVAATGTAPTVVPEIETCGTLDDYNGTEPYRDCLAENTTTTELLSIISEPPSNASQPQIDAVYAANLSAHNLTDQQESRVTDWMLWEKAGVRPTWASDGGGNETNTTMPVASTAQGADLAVEQPGYVDERVRRGDADGTPQYVVRGERLDLKPRNFDPDDVATFGVAGDVGELVYDRAFDIYRLRPSGEGTYRLYWIVDAAGEQIRYEASVRVAGQAALIHQTEGSQSQQREAAQNWWEFNQTFHDMGFGDPGVSQEEEIQEMLNWYDLHPSNDPLSALTGGFTSWVIITVTTAGGALAIALILAYHTGSVYTLYRRLNVFRSVEAEEGDARAAIEEMDRRENERIAQNTDPRDIFEDDHIAAAWRETFGDNLRDGAIRYLALTRPRNLIANRLRAMGQVGWVGRRTATDGGDEDAGEASVELVKERELPDDVDETDTVSLVDVEPDDDVVSDLDWSGAPLRSFELPAADYDASEADIEFEEHDLETLIERFEADMRHFRDEQAFGEYLREFVSAINEHPMTDRDGSVNGVHYTMESFLKHAEVMGDRFSFPAFDMIEESISRALVDYDREQSARDLVTEVRNGGAG